jgi:hypothetical protein
MIQLDKKKSDKTTCKTGTILQNNKNRIKVEK